MSTSFSVLGLICARGGSKGVPQKNIKDLCGKPLIAWSIETALESAEIDDVLVSTDDPKIAEIGKEYGADVPFLRPKHLAQDNSKQVDAIAHALAFMKDRGQTYDVVVLLQPTCPLRIPEDISQALSIFRETDADSVISVTEEDGVTLSTYYDLDENGLAHPKFPVPKDGTNRQDYAPIHRRCGSLYLFRPANILENHSLYGDRVSAYVIPKERAFDIDTPIDWMVCEYFMKKRIDP